MQPLTTAVDPANLMPFNTHAPPSHSINSILNLKEKKTQLVLKYFIHLVEVLNFFFYSFNCYFIPLSH